MTQIYCWVHRSSHATMNRFNKRQRNKCLTFLFLWMLYVFFAMKIMYFIINISIEIDDHDVKSDSESIRIHYYNPYPWIEPSKIFQSCDYKCHLTTGITNYQDSHVVIFYGPLIARELFGSTSNHHIRLKPPRKQHGQIWVFHSMEPPGTKFFRFKKWNSLFNWTMSHRQDSDFVSSYGYFRGIKDNAKTVARTNNDLFMKTKRKQAAWFVSNCNTYSDRESYVKKLKQHMDVDIYGRCGDKVCTRKHSASCKEMLEKKYYFYLAFESALCRDYYTEKVTYFYQTKKHVVPVTRGLSKNSMYKRILPPGSYIDTSNFMNTSDLADYLKKKSNNHTAYKQFFKWREYYDFYGYDAYCGLCKKAHLEKSNSWKEKKLYIEFDKWIGGGDDVQICRNPTDTK